MGRGPLFMVAAMLCFAVHDAIGKYVTGIASIPQVLAIEAALALAVLTPWFLRRGFSVLLQVQDPWLHALRVALVVGEMACLYAALRGASLTDVIVLYQVAPALTVIMASFVLGERPGPLGWMSILLGFVGVLLIVKPDEPDVSTAHAIALLGMSLYAAFNLLTRQLRAAEPATLLGWHMGGMLIVGLVLVPFHWKPLDIDTVSLMAIMGVLAGMGALLVNTALAAAQTPRIMPLHYTIIVWAMLFGWLYWGERPDISTILGAIMIVLSGLLAVRFVGR
jgi:drug/metabolite transporter (DMT)-like permease